MGGSDFEGFMKAAWPLSNGTVFLPRTNLTTPASVGSSGICIRLKATREPKFNFLNDILHESETSYKKFRDGDEDPKPRAAP